jgi:hypothetical protein
MCDTLGVLFDGHSLFGKNSDRSPNEAQVTEFYPARVCKETSLSATYVAIPQARDTKAVLLSRPVWMWGAEIGVNEAGVAIGNEAVFTKGPYGKPALTGMDLLRLALERSESAESAVNTIIELLETYGQGGNCGFDHTFYYDNSFLVIDRDHLFVLETCAKSWCGQVLPQGFHQQPPQYRNEWRPVRRRSVRLCKSAHRPAVYLLFRLQTASGPVRLRAGDHRIPQLAWRVRCAGTILPSRTPLPRARFRAAACITAARSATSRRRA